MLNNKLFATVAIAVSAFVAGGCTVDDPVVNDPQVNQNQDNDDVEVCVQDCDETSVTCTGSCNDDVCRGRCETDHDECVTTCEEQ